LPIYLHKIVPATLAVIISTVFLVIFGEILPQAFCTGPSQIKIAVFCEPIIKVMEFVFYPICRPMARFLDWFLGVHGKQRFPKKDLKALIEIHMDEVQRTQIDEKSHRK